LLDLAQPQRQHHAAGHECSAIAHGAAKRRASALGSAALGL
jgi:hypothetical protein